MKKSLFKFYIFTIICIFQFNNSNAQVKFSITLGGDIYQHFMNPKVQGDSTLRSSGCFYTNLITGPKLWYIINDFSLSLEGQVNWGVFALCLKENKGMGALSFPIIAKINLGNRGETHNKFGISLGGGIQYSKTEIYGLKDSFKIKTTRFFYKTYFGELSIILDNKMGNHGGFYYIRYGRGNDNSSIFTLGCVGNIFI